MKHLIISREYPPASGGGIGTYVFHISRLLAEAGETVHVICQLWEGAQKQTEERCSGRLIIHRIPYLDWTSFFGPKPSPAIKSKIARNLFHSNFSPQCFSWQVSLLAERLVEQEGIDVIEAQEYEAPLYYFQVRRTEDVGLTRRPPCIVHLHSPTEYITKYNDWNMHLPTIKTAKCLEEYSILAADALLCPSRFLANQIETKYQLAPNTIRVIPYPLGNQCLVARKNTVWENGTVCYVARIERRKGVIEWIDAAATVAEHCPTALFEFIGADTLSPEGMSCEEYVRNRIPKALRSRFKFSGKKKRSDIARLLSKARIAVVPSRWENFPYSCIEAMSSGLPMIATRQGGMMEMIRDNETGWLANNVTSADLAEVLIRALATPPKKIAEMGQGAASQICLICDNEKILENHLDFRNQLVKRRTEYCIYSQNNLPSPKAFFPNELGSETNQLTNLSALKVNFWHPTIIRRALRRPGTTGLMVLRKLKNKVVGYSHLGL